MSLDDSEIEINIPEEKEIETNKKVLLLIEDDVYYVGNLNLDSIQYSPIFNTMYEGDKTCSFLLAQENKINKIDNYYIACAFSYYLYWINIIPKFYNGDFPLIFLPITDTDNSSYKQTLLDYGREEQEINFYINIPSHLLPIILNLEHKYDSINSRCPSLPDKYKIKNTDKYVYGELGVMIATRIQNIIKSDNGEEKFDINFMPNKDFMINRMKKNNIFIPEEICKKCILENILISKNIEHQHI